MRNFNKRGSKKQKEEKGKVIILFGPPGAGKGTQAELLADYFHFYYLETSKIIEENVMDAKPGQYVTVQNKRYSLLHERKLWRAGRLCSPPVVSYWVKQKIRELSRREKGIIIAGSPRTLYEGKDQIPFLKKLFGRENIKVVVLEIPPRETIRRNSNRRICKLMRHPILYSKETVRLRRCPLDGSRLVRRKGLDDVATIKIRLEEYKNRTFPLLAYFKEQGLKVKRVDGRPSVEKVFQGVLRAICHQ